MAYQDDGPQAGVLNCGAVHALAAPSGDEVGAALALGAVDPALAGSSRPIGDLDLLPPVAPEVLLVAEDNYRSQARPRRAGLALQRPAVLEPFLLPGPADDVLITACDPASIIVSGNPVVRPAGCRQLDAGVSLLVVAGRAEAGRPPPVGALGLCVDVVRRDVPQTQAFLARSFPSHTVVGAALVTLDEVGDLADVRLTLEVDGQRRQEGSTSDLVASPAQLLEVIGRRYPLRAGDVVLTGTPPGVALDSGDGWLLPGNQVRAEIEGVGMVEAEIVEESAG